MWHQEDTGKGQWKMGVSWKNCEGRQIWPTPRHPRSQSSKQTSSSLHLKFYFQSHLSSQLWIADSQIWKNMSDNLQVVRCSKNTDDLQNLQCAWHTELGTDEDQIQTLQLKVARPPLPWVLSGRTTNECRFEKGATTGMKFISKSLPLPFPKLKLTHLFTGGVGSECGQGSEHIKHLDHKVCVFWASTQRCKHGHKCKSKKHRHLRS